VVSFYLGLPELPDLLLLELLAPLELDPEEDLAELLLLELDLLNELLLVFGLE
jgi:hypothetical protein